MPEQLADDFSARLASAEADLRVITEFEASEPYKPDVWTRKQVLGHLIDSAINNHVRFAVAALDAEYSGPAYHAQGWVAIHDYANMQWSELLELWKAHNALLARVVRQIADDKLAAQCRIGNDPPVTLRYVIEDYLRHMEEHVTEITESQAPRQMSA
ncbi:MAG: DinB family protein [Terriglobia bacterium]|nr:DinB family protein [Terriglobia bacterium]